MIIHRVIENIERVIIGKREEITLILSAMLAGGHVLLEDVPGTGKTVLAKALSQSFDCTFSRIQFTPDLLPGELTGINFYNQKTGEFTFRKGSLFANIVLGDEINRATPRTQSGLLESMEEGQITVDGVTHVLPAPYFVIATQNPIETQGTFPLPEAQLDRFLLQLKLGYATTAESAAILKRFTAPAEAETDSPLAALRPVCSLDDLLAMREAVKSVFIHDVIYDYIARLAEATRTHERVALGISTRGMLALAKLARAKCAIKGEDFVSPQDVLDLMPYAFGHRLLVKGGIHRRAEAVQAILEEIQTTVDAPVEAWKIKD